MTIRFWCFGSAIALAASTLGTSLHAQRKSDDQLVVTGQMEQARREVGEMTQAVTRRPRIDKPVSRRYAAVCLGVSGMGEDFAHILIDRIETNVRSLDLRVLGPGCVVNTLVVFTNNSRAQIEKLHREEPQWFESLLDYEYRRVLAGNGAVQSWHSTEVKGADGRAFSEIIINGRPVPLNVAFVATRFAQQIRVDIEASIVVFDNAFVPGKSIQQLADYATMRLFAPTDDMSARSAGGMNTILALFEPGASAPDGLTAFDRALARFTRCPRQRARRSFAMRRGPPIARIGTRCRAIDAHACVASPLPQAIMCMELANTSLLRLRPSSDLESAAIFRCA